MFGRFGRNAAALLAVMGPGIITAVVDNDAGGIYTYSEAGARYGYLTLWTLLPVTVVLIATQEMCARMGAVTGKGLYDLIREEFGLRTTFFVMAGLLVVNLANVAANFAFPLVPDPPAVLIVDLVQANIVILCGAVELHWYVDQTECDRSLPNGPHAPSQQHNTAEEKRWQASNRSG